MPPYPGVVCLAACLLGTVLRRTPRRRRTPTVAAALWALPFLVACSDESTGPGQPPGGSAGPPSDSSPAIAPAPSAPANDAPALSSSPDSNEPTTAPEAQDPL